MRALRIDRYGPLSDLALSDVARASLGADEVRIAVEAAGVNPSDTGVALGRFPQVVLPVTLGRDFAGRVIEGPSELLNAPVWGSGGGTLGVTRDGTHAQELILPADAVIRRPDSLNAQQAAAVGVPYVTAWSALVDLAGFQGGEAVIVAGAAGAVGTAACAIVNALGGTAIALVRSGTDLSPLDGLQVEVVYSDRDDIAQTIKKLTAGRGANVALNGVGAPVFGPMIDSLAKDGRMVVYSMREGREAQLDLFALYRGRLKLFGLDTAVLTLEHIAVLFEKFAPLFNSGALRPPAVAATFPLEQARDAYERVGGGVTGKVVLVP